MKSASDTQAGLPPRKPLYTQDDLAGLAHLHSAPGKAPFVRGPYASMYTTRPWTIRQYAGFADADASNAFFHQLLGGGAQGLSVAFDLPTHRGYDSDHPNASADVGLAGVAIDSVEDMHRLFDGIALDRVSVSMTMSGAVLPVLGSFIVAARERGIDPAQLTGTIQNDILKEFQVRNTYIYAPEPSLRIATDVVAYAAQHMPRFHAMSISGYHFQEAGADAPLELALTMANAREYLRALQARGMDVDHFCQRLSFFFGVGMDFYGEVAKLRAARLLWAEIVAAHGGTHPRAQALRMHCQTSGWSLTAADPMNNVARTTIEAMAAIFGGTQSLHTNAYDEALALPSDEAARLARNTQLILQQETGLCEVIDPWAGSFMMERLTADMAESVRRRLADIDAQGGVLAALEQGLHAQDIHIAANRTQAALDSGERVQVGVNAHLAPGAQSVPARTLDATRIRADQVARLAALRAGRDSVRVKAALRDLTQCAVQGDGNLLEATMRALSARATLGECTAALEAQWPRYLTVNRYTANTYGRERPADDPGWALACEAAARARHDDGRPASILIAKLGQDGHDRGAKAVAAALTDAGFTVHLGDLFETPESVARLAAAHEVDAVGLSTLAGAHKTLAPQLVQCLRDQQLGHCPLLLGGVIPDADHELLKRCGVAAIFGPGTAMESIAMTLSEHILAARRAGEVQDALIQHREPPLTLRR